MDKNIDSSMGCICFISIGLCIVLALFQDWSCSCGKAVGVDKQTQTRLTTIESNLVELKNYLDLAHGSVVRSNK